MPEVSLPTQKFVEVADIKNGVVYLKRGGLRKVLIVGGINFDLKSEAEQNLILQSFQNFLNTLDFGVQFFIHSRKININEYLEKLRARKEEEQNELLKVQIEDYAEFIRAFVEENSIISKDFFVVVPYDPITVAAQAKGLLGLFKKAPTKKEETAKEERDRKNIEELEQRANEVVSGLEQIGLRATALEDEELIELFYNLYNPQLVEKKDLEIAKK
ncbi:MAG TPA: TraC family protein [Candidatus Paceibacterota bacterium]|nr:TraC family protein [Candidatus Paceibacterota bacterium]